MTRHLQVTLAVSGTVYDLVTLIRALTQIVTEEALPAPFPTQVASLSIVPSVGAMTLVDARLDSQIGQTYAAAAKFQEGPYDNNAINLHDFKMKGDTTSTVLSICLTAH